jgi:hypothetical protein
MNTFFYNFSFLFFVFRENITTLQSDNVIPAASVGRLTKVSATKKNFQFRQKKRIKDLFFSHRALVFSNTTCENIFDRFSFFSLFSRALPNGFWRRQAPLERHQE